MRNEEKEFVFSKPAEDFIRVGTDLVVPPAASAFTPADLINPPADFIFTDRQDDP